MAEKRELEEEISRLEEEIQKLTKLQKENIDKFDKLEKEYADIRGNRIYDEDLRRAKEKHIYSDYVIKILFIIAILLMAFGTYVLMEKINFAQPIVVCPAN
ncbi:MAG: hypothetical protein GX282_03730 [Campylobacteraceae bacterium]|nr:hypothetical protein [Campylobacteraceae bacterium]